MNEEHLDKFIEILETFDTAMLVTRRGSELRSRPMAIADKTRDGRVWFVTSVDSAKLEELTEHPEVNVAMQAESKFLSISGTFRATRDREKIDELWQTSFENSFEKGKDDPALVLLEIVPTYVEYWDQSGAQSISFMFAAAKGAVTGEAPEAEGMHGKVDFPRTETELHQPSRH